MMRNHGDVLLSGPVFSVLKNRLPQSTVDAYIRQESLPLLKGRKDIDGFLLYDKKEKKGGFFKKLSYELSLLKEIRKNRYDLIIHLTEGDRGAIATRISGARYKLGYAVGSKRKQKIYTHLVKTCGQNRHTVEKNLDALRRMGIFPKKEEKELQFAMSNEEIQNAKNLLSFSEPFILLHPASRWRFKCWPKHHVRSCIEKLLEENERIVLVSGKDAHEQLMVKEILQDLNHPNILNLSGKTTLKELGALIHLSKALICMDSISFHLANALKAKVVAIFGPTSPITWGPWQNPKARVVKNSFQCMPCFQDGCGGSKVSDCLVELEPEKVLSALYALIK